MFMCVHTCLRAHMGVRVCYVCMCLCVCTCVCACVHVCAYVCVWVDVAHTRAAFMCACVHVHVCEGVGARGRV